MTETLTPSVTIRPDGNMSLWRKEAFAVYAARSWPTDDPMSEMLRALRSNPNYGPGPHPMWVQWRGAGVCSLLPAQLADSEEPDLWVVIEADESFDA